MQYYDKDELNELLEEIALEIEQTMREHREDDGTREEMWAYQHSAEIVRERKQ